MSDQENAQDVIEKFQKRQQRAQKAGGAFVIGAIAILLIFVGGVFLFQWFTNDDFDPLAAFQPEDTATPTPLPTDTPTPLPPTETPLPPTETALTTDIPSITPTPTIDGPFIYTVAEGDTLFSIAEQFGVELVRLMEVNELEDGNIFINQQLLIPDPNEEPPTSTP